MNKFGEESQYLNVKMFSVNAWEATFLADALADAGLMGAAIGFVSIYSFFVLGGCSPIHFRGCTSSVGILCVVLATLTGYSVSFAFGL